jgi:hypothetical protein
VAKDGFKLTLKVVDATAAIVVEYEADTHTLVTATGGKDDAIAVFFF